MRIKHDLSSGVTIAWLRSPPRSRERKGFAF